MIRRGKYLLAVSLLMIASFIINLGFSALSPVFPYLILALKGVLKDLPELTKESIEAHKGAIEFGLLTAAFMITRAPAAGIIGFISDILGRKVTILLGMSLYSLSSLGFMLSNDLLLFMLFRGLQGMASAMVWPVAEAYLADITPRWSRGRVISIYSSSMLIAEILGPSIGVAIYKIFINFFGKGDVILALKAPIIFLTISCLISTATLIFLPSISYKRVDVSKINEGFKEILMEMKSLPDHIARSLKVIYVNGLINGLAMGILDTAAIVYIIERIAKDPLLIGIFFSIFSSIALPATLIGGYLSDRIKRRKPLIIIGYVIGRTTFFLVPLVKSYIMIIIVGILLSLIFGFSSPIMRALQADLAPESIRGSIFGLQQLFFNTGILIGAILGGYLTERYAITSLNLFNYTLTGFIIPFWLAGTLGIITTILFALYVESD